MQICGMENLSSFAPATLSHGGSTYLMADLPALSGARHAALPVVLRILLENLLRNTDGAERE